MGLPALLFAASVLACSQESANRFPELLVAAMGEAERVESFQVYPSVGESSGLGRSLGRLGDYEIRTVGPPLSRDQIGQMTDLLLDESNYLPNDGPAKMCLFVPRHGLRFTGEKYDPVEALICFECNQAFLTQGVVKGGGDFDPMEGALAEMFLELFPGDETIR